MKKTLLSLVFTALLLTTSCVPSLYPLYLEKDVFHEPALFGVWADSEGETWVLTDEGTPDLRLLHIDGDGKSGDFTARLVRIGEERFLDIVPVKKGIGRTDFYQGNLFATHTFIHLRLKGPNIQISVLEPKWLKDTLAEKPDVIRHEWLNGEIVLSAPPKEMQAFLVSSLKTPGAFTEPTELTRKAARRSH